MSYDESEMYDFPCGLQLKVQKHGEDSVEFELKNKFFYQQRFQKLKQLFALSFLFALYYCMIRIGANTNFRILQRNLLADGGFLFYIIYLIVSACNLIKREKLLCCADFGIQMETQQLFSRCSNMFIPTRNVYDVRINEVIEKVDIHYILIVRTKGELFQRKPIIPLFNAQKPPIKCLEIIYKHLNKILHSQTHSDHTYLNSSNACDVRTHSSINSSTL